MISSLYQNGVVQFLLVVLTAPLWSPVLKLLWSEMHRAADDERRGVRWFQSAGRRDEGGAAIDVAPAVGTGAGLWSQDADETWSRRRMVNAAWDTGRRAATRSAREGGPGELTRRVLEASERGAHGFGRRPM